MNTENDITIEAESPQFVEPGTLLKEKREALGLTQQQVADRLRLRLSIIQNLEENKFDTDLVATFIRGYLRSYAKAVGLKESEVLEAYAQRSGSPQQEQTMQSFSKKTKRAKHDSHIMTITWVIMIVLIGMSSLWWWQNHRDTGFSTDPNAEVSAVLDNEGTIQQSNSEQEFATVSELTEESGEETIEPAQPTLVEESSDEVVNDEVANPDVATQAEESQTVVTEEVAVEATTDESVVAEEPAVPVASDNLLTMSFSADCWVQVKDASGKTLVTGIKQAGQSVSLNGQKPLQVILGAPEGVTMTFASEPVDLSGYTSGKVARFTLP